MIVEQSERDLVERALDRRGLGQDSVVTDDRAGGAEGTLRAHLAAYGRKSAPTRARYATI